jgi:hypothetical protein
MENSPDKGVDQLFINPQSKGRKHKKKAQEYFLGNKKAQSRMLLNNYSKKWRVCACLSRSYW